MDNFEQTVLIQLGEIKALCATNKAKQEENEHRLDALDKTNTRQYWLHTLSPAMLIIAGIAHRLGIA